MMEDLTALERQIGEELSREIGPLPRFDVATVVRSAEPVAPSTVRASVRASFRPVRTMAVGAIALALGGALLIGRPLAHEGSVAPGAAPDGVGPVPGTTADRCLRLPPTAQVPIDCRVTLVYPPVEVAGTIEAGARCLGGGGGAMHGVLHEGCIRQPAADWSDPRLDGTLTIAASMDRYLNPPGGGLAVWTFAIRIENDEGAWQMRPISAVGRAGGAEADLVTWILEGEGAYEGLTAVLRSEGPLYDTTEFSVEGSRSTPPAYEPQGHIVAHADLWGLGDPMLGDGPADG